MKKELMDEVRKEVVEFLLQKTHEEFGVTAGKLSHKAQKLQRIIDGGAFGCNSRAVAEVLSVILEEKITSKKSSGKDHLDGYIGAVVVALKNDNGHNYSIGKPVVITEEEGVGIEIGTASSQNHITSRVRAASDKEIKNWVDKAPVAALISVAALMDK